MRILLQLLVLACLLPGVIGAVVLFGVQYRAGQIQLEDDRLRVTRALSQAVDHELAVLQGKLQILALSPELMSSDLSGFYREAQATLATESLATAIALIDSTGQQLLNTVRPLGALLPKTGHPLLVRRTFDSGRPTVSDMYIGGATLRPSVAVEVPVWHDGRVKYALDMGIPLEGLTRILTKQKLPGGWVSVVMDSQGVILARNHDPTRFVGHVVGGPESQNRMLATAQGSFESTTLEGIPSFITYSRSPLTNWTFAIAVPRQPQTEELVRNISLFGLGIAVLFSVGLALAWNLGNSISHSVRALRAPALALEHGEPVVTPRVYFREADDVAQSMAHTALLLQMRTLALHDSVERLRVGDLALKAISQGVLVTDVEGRILSANESFQTISGFCEAEILGRKCNFVQGPLTDPQTLEAIRQAVRNTTTFSGEILNYRKNGTTFWNELSISPVRNEQGQLTHFIGIIRDGTARKAAEAELDQHRLNLERLVSSRTEELAHARDAAESANNAKSDFLSTMSHELRTPLNAVIGLAGLLNESPLNRRQRNYSDKIQLSATALRTIIDDILDFSKIEAGALQLEHSPFSLNAILHTLATGLGVGLRDKPVEALLDVAHDIPEALVGDALRLQQILLNLTNNAIKFTERGTILVTVRCLDRTSERATMEFIVRDTGIGIASEHLNAIFDGFVQANKSTSRLYGGSGLGLTISARLAQLMNGRIDVRSTEGVGSEFCLRVTLNLGPSEPLPDMDEHLHDIHILIVDDHPLAREILTRTCVGFGWQATAVEGGAQGLNALRRGTGDDHDYDLLLLDWHMPDMDGIEMLRAAYATPGVGLPLVVLMAPIFELEKAVAASDDVHLDGIVGKPVTPANLMKTVQQAYAGEYLSILPLPRKTDRRLAGLRLLVAEDNALNQEVIQEILTRAGAEVVLTNDGLAAVDALRTPNSHFDAVLMDIQMPIMDGYAATRTIREELGMTDIPVIAVTAYARPEDLEKSRLAGMTGHLVKPINIEDLLDIVDKTRLSSDSRPAPLEDPFSESEETAIAFVGLDVSGALKAFGSDKSKYLKLLQKFILHYGDNVDGARRQYDADAPQAAQEIIHGFRGIARILHATDLARLAGLAEGALLDGNTDALPQMFDDLERAMSELRESAHQLEALWAEA